MAKVKKVAPQPARAPEGAPLDIETLRAIIVNRMHVLRDYKKQVTLPVLKVEKARAAMEAQSARLWRRAKKLVVRQPSLLDDAAKQRLSALLSESKTLETVHQFRMRLQDIWSGAQNLSNEKLLASLKEWCQEAEASGIKALQEFSETLKGYALANATR